MHKNVFNSKQIRDKKKLDTTENPKDNSIIECIYKLIGNMVHTFE